MLCKINVCMGDQIVTSKIRKWSLAHFCQNANSFPIIRILTKRDWNYFLISHICHLINLLISWVTNLLTIMDFWLVYCVKKFHARRWHGNFVISLVKNIISCWNFAPKLWSNLSHMILLIIFYRFSWICSLPGPWFDYHILPGLWNACVTFLSTETAEYLIHRWSK